MIEENMNNKKLSSLACKDSDAIYFEEESSDYRTPFFKDIDNILYTLAFQRYSDKTQVFSFKENDHLSKRMIHVQYVSKIARTIGRALGLNEDLIEAAALGHDLGHTPFGHVGEKILNDISVKAGVGYFNHNIHSIRILMSIENYGKGKNITLQTLDAIMCHNGEIVSGLYKPKKKTKEEFLIEYENTYKDKELIKKLEPMTLEGCVVRISDLIAYLGRDIEDGIRMNLITKEDIPSDIKNILGSSNKEIINTIVTDIINNSINKNYIKMSNEVYEAVEKLKTFNYKYIYDYAYTKKELNLLESILNTLYKTYLNDLINNNTESNIIKSYLSKLSDEYKNNNSNEKIVIDYIAGMTDDFAKKEYNKIKKMSHNKNSEV